MVEVVHVRSATQFIKQLLYYRPLCNHICHGIFVVDYETLTRIDYFNQKKFCLAHDEDTIWFISAWGQFNIYYRWP